MIDWQPIFLTLKLAVTTTAVLFVLAIPLSVWLSGKKTFAKILVETLVSLPMVLPPTVIGFYLLVAFSPERGIGKWLSDHYNIQLAFSFTGLLIGSLIYSLPFMVQPIKSGLSELPANLKEAAYTIGKSKWETVFKVLLPNAKHAILTGIIFTFAHTIGEFGVVLMIGGNIPGKTQTASIALFDEVENFNYGAANKYALILIAFSFIVLIFLNLYSRNKKSFTLS